MSHRATYARRVAAGQCPGCAQRAEPGSIYCPDCQAASRAYYHIHSVPSPQGILPHVAGPLLACCGVWQKIQSLPMCCRECRRVYLNEIIKGP